MTLLHQVFPLGMFLEFSDNSHLPCPSPSDCQELSAITLTMKDDIQIMSVTQRVFLEG